MTTTDENATTDAASRNPADGTGIEALAHLHDGGDYRRLAERTAEPVVLRELARCEYPFVWHAIAKNPATPVDTLAGLADRYHSDYNDNLLLLLLVGHPSVTGACLDRVVEAVARKLAAGERPYRAAMELAARTDLPAERVLQLGAEPGASARLRRGLSRVLAARPAD